MESPLMKMDSKWLAENIKEMDQIAKQMLKLIEENNESEMVKDHMCHLNKTELIASVEDFYRIYRSLAQGYDNLSKELYTNVALEVQKQDLEIAEPGADNSSTMVTPNEKIRPLKSGNRSAYFSCGGGSSDLSVQEGTESFSTSSDSDSESFNSSFLNYLSSPVGNDGKGLNLKVLESEAEFPDMKDNLQGTDKELVVGLLKVEEHGNYQYMIDRMKKYEEELSVTKFKLQLAEEEVVNLKIELESNESVLALAGSLKTQLESSQSVLKTREADLEMERRRTHELQKQVVELGTQVLDSKSDINKLLEELEASRDMLKGLSAEISKLNHELNSERRQVIDLEETIVSYKAYLSDRDHHVDELKTALCDVETNFSAENATLQHDITCLSEKQHLLEARLKEWESLGASLEDKITKCNADKMEMKLLHEAEKVGLQTEVNGLKADLAVRGEHVKMLNKNLDKLNVKYDMLVAEKDECNAKIDTLVADLRSREIQMGEMKNNLSQLNGKRKELISGFENSTKHVEELRVRVEELEKEVEKQRNEVIDGADKKREAIRQLCLTLDHYKSGYRQLCQAFPGHKGHAVIAN